MTVRVSYLFVPSQMASASRQSFRTLPLGTAYVPRPVASVPVLVKKVVPVRATQRFTPQASTYRFGFGHHDC